MRNKLISIGFIICLITIFGYYHIGYNRKGYCTVLEVRPYTNITSYVVYREEGFYFVPLFNLKTSTYPLKFVVDFITNDHPLLIRLNDGSTVIIQGKIDFSLPDNDHDIEQFHKWCGYGNQWEDGIKTHIIFELNEVGSHYSGKQVYEKSYTIIKPLNDKVVKYLRNLKIMTHGLAVSNIIIDGGIHRYSNSYINMALAENMYESEKIQAEAFSHTPKSMPRSNNHLMLSNHLHNHH